MFISSSSFKKNFFITIKNNKKIIIILNGNYYNPKEYKISQKLFNLIHKKRKKIICLLD